MPDSTTQSANVPASASGTATDTNHNDDNVYVNLSYNFDPRDTVPPEFPAEMSVYATPSARQRVLNSTRGTGAVLASLGTSIQAQNTICPIRGPLLPEAKGNTKGYQWKEWKRQTGKQWTDGLGDYNNRTRGKTGLKMAEVTEPSEAWQKEMGVSLVPMGEVYSAVRESERTRATTFQPRARMSQPEYLDSRPSVGWVRSGRDVLFLPTFEGADHASDSALIAPPTIPEDEEDASSHT